MHYCTSTGQTTPRPGGLADKGKKGKHARVVPLILEIRELVADRLDQAASPDSRLFVGPRGPDQHGRPARVESMTLVDQERRWSARSQARPSIGTPHGGCASRH